MTVEIRMRISTENVTSRQFDQLIVELKDKVATTEQVDSNTLEFGYQLTDIQTQLQNVNADVGAVTDALDLVRQNYVQTAVKMEDYHNGLIALEGAAADADDRLTSLRETIHLPHVSEEGAIQDAISFRTVENEAHLVNRSITEFGNGLQKAFGSIQTDQINARLNEIGQSVHDFAEFFISDLETLDRAAYIRNFKFESEEQDRFSNITDTTELESTKQRHLSVLDDMTRVRQEQIEEKIAVEGAAMSRLSNQEQSESEHAKNIRELTAQLQQLEVDYELEKTQITREEVETRTEINERTTQLQIDLAKSQAAIQLKTHQAVFGEISRTLREFDDTSLQDRTHNIFGGLLTQRVATHEVYDQAQGFVPLTGGMENSLQNLETSLYEFASIFRREFTETVQYSAKLLGDFGDRVRAPGLAVLTDELRGINVISRLDAGLVTHDQRTSEILAAGAETFRELDRYRTDQARSFVSRPRREQAFSRERLTEGLGDLVSSVPLDVVDAVTNSVQLRSDATAALVQLEQEAAAEIKIIQESTTLAAANKAKAIERVERQSALERIRIENEVSQQQRASFQSVVTNFLSGTAQMIAAEAQLSLARRATDSLGNLFGGAGLFSSVLFPLLGGLGLAYGASELISLSSPSVEVYQKSQYGVLGGGTDLNVQDMPKLRPASQESETPTLEANLNVTVEASGTRLGQANERVKLKTSRWGG